MEARADRPISLCLCLLLLLFLTTLSLVPQQNSPASSDGEARLQSYVIQLLNETTQSPVSKARNKKLFEEKYQRPNKQLVAGFFAKPRVVVTKLQEELQRQEVKAARIKEEFGLLKAIFRRADDGAVSRRRRAVSSLVPCSVPSPLLLGALVVDE